MFHITGTSNTINSYYVLVWCRVIQRYIVLSYDMSSYTVTCCRLISDNLCLLSSNFLLSRLILYHVALFRIMSSYFVLCRLSSYYVVLLRITFVLALLILHTIALFLMIM